MSTKVLSTFAQNAVNNGDLSPYFATISKDNRIKLWNTTTANLQYHFTEPQHLGSIYTAVALYVGGAISNVLKDSSRTSAMKITNGLLAVGNKKGTITIWKLQTGDIIQRFGADGEDGHDSQVNDVIFNSDGTKLYSASIDGVVIEWDVESGKILRSFTLSKQSITKLAISSDDKLLLAGSSTVKLVDLSSENVIAEYSGQVNEVTSLQFANDNKIFVVGCAEDRFINVWPVISTEAVVSEDDSSKKKKKKALASLEQSTAHINLPLATVSLDSPPVHIAIKVVTSTTTKTTKKSTKAVKAVPTASVQLATVSYKGVASVWDISEAVTTFYASNYSTLSKEPSTFSNSNTEISVIGANSGAESVAAMSAYETQTATNKKGKKIETSTTVSYTTEGAIIAVQLSSESKLLIARYSSIQPQFEIVSYLTEENTFIPTIQLAKFKTQHLELDSTDASSRKRKDSDKLSTTTSQATVVGPALMGIKPVTSSLDAYSTSSDLIASYGLEAGETVHAKRMRLLAASGELTKSLAERIKESQEQTVQLSGQPLGGSLQTVLAQALHSNDDKLLEQVISIGAANANKTQKSNTIKATITRLAPNFIVPLLSKLISKLQENPNRGLELVPWVRECLRIHTAYLLTVPQLASQLSTLYKIVEQRLVPFNKLLNLQGRIDLVMSQISRNNNISNTNVGPGLEYVESDDIAQERMMARKSAANAAYGQDDYDESGDDEDLFDEDDMDDFDDEE